MILHLLALAASLSLAGETRVSVQLQQAPLAGFLDRLKISYVVAEPLAQEKVDADMKNVVVSEALDIVTSMKGAVWTKSGDVYVIAKATAPAVASQAQGKVSLSVKDAPLSDVWVKLGRPGAPTAGEPRVTASLRAVPLKDALSALSVLRKPRAPGRKAPRPTSKAR